MFPTIQRSRTLDLEVYPESEVRILTPRGHDLLKLKNHGVFFSKRGGNDLRSENFEFLEYTTNTGVDTVVKRKVKLIMKL